MREGVGVAGRKEDGKKGVKQWDPVREVGWGRKRGGRGKGGEGRAGRGDGGRGEGGELRE